MACKRPIEAVIKWRWYVEIHYADENNGILIQISLNLAQQDQINNKLALVQMMAWSQTDESPLSERMMA